MRDMEGEKGRFSPHISTLDLKAENGGPPEPPG